MAKLQTPKANSQYPQMPYDLIREFLIAMLVMGLVVLALAGVFSTPDVPALTAKQVVQQDPRLLVQTALDDLSQQDPISGYGPPYNHTPGAAQSLGFISPQTWGGVQIPVNSMQDEIIRPLQTISGMNPALATPLRTWGNATAQQQSAWVQAVSKNLDKATVTSTSIQLPGTTADYGPVPQLLNGYLVLANSGLLEPAIDGINGPMPITDRTKALLLLQDQPDATYADLLDMTGDEWGIIKETGNYPGAVWLWYYTLLYQIPPFSSSDAADLLVVFTVGLVTLLLMLTPFIPGLRSLPRGLGVYRLIWKNHYARQRRTPS